MSILFICWLEEFVCCYWEKGYWQDLLLIDILICYVVSDSIVVIDGE